VEAVEGAAAISPVPEGPAEAAGATATGNAGRDGQREKLLSLAAAGVIPTEFLCSGVALLRPAGLLCSVPAHEAVAGAAVLFPGLPARSGACSAQGEALAPTAPRPEGDGSPQEESLAPPTLKAC
jgi:hypothetical protein